VKTQRNGERDVLLRHLQPPHLHQVLRDLCYPLLALVRDEVGPVDEFRVDLAGV
jgi:hypothetical protein